MKRAIVQMMLICACILGFALLLAPTESVGFILVLASGTAAAMLLFGFRKKLRIQIQLHKALCVYDATLTVLLCQDFIYRWSPSRKIDHLAVYFHLPKQFF